MLKIDIEGYERLFSAAPRTSTKIAHSMLISVPLDIDEVHKRVTDGFYRVMNENPRMRAMQCRDEPLKATIADGVSMEKVKKLVQLLRELKDWEKFVEDECNRIFKRTEELPFMMFVAKDAHGIRLLLFSDHYMSDGYSGMCILSQLLEYICTPKDTPLNKKQLLPSIYSLQIHDSFPYKLLAFLARPLVKSMLDYQDVLLPVPKWVKPFQLPDPEQSPTRALFSSTLDIVSSIKSRCREEQVTMHGAVCVAAYVAVMLTKYGPKAFTSSESKQGVMIDIDFNIKSN